MSDTSQSLVVRNYQRRLAERGLVRFEVLGRTADRELIRPLAKRLTEKSEEVDRLLSVVRRSLSGNPPRKGGILAALRQSPFVDADIIPPRPFEPGRKVDL